METQNLWPDFSIETTRSPKTILKEQAGYLMEKTNNVLSANIETVHSQGDIIHQFYVVAPAMNNYRYMLFSVKHKIVAYYPLNVLTEMIVQEDAEGTFSFEIPVGAKNEEEFIEILSRIFKDTDTMRVISSLLSQSLSE